MENHPNGVANMTAIQKKLIWTNANDKNVLDFHGDDLMLNLNVHQIGTIESFDATTQTASATIDVQKVLYVQDPETQLISQLLQPYPSLTDCPVKFTCGQNGGVTVPVKEGDKCLIHFNDRDIDAWFAGAINQGPNTARLHDFWDAIIEIGPNPAVAPLPNFSTQYVMLRNGAGNSFVGIDISNGKISIQNQAGNLNSILQSLITHIQEITIIGGAVSPTSQAQLASDAVNLGTVLQ